jgi:hypothetical protein
LPADEAGRGTHAEGTGISCITVQPPFLRQAVLTGTARRPPGLGRNPTPGVTNTAGADTRGKYS